MKGYIYSMRNSMVEFDSDLEIQSASNPAAEWLPSNALALLTHISFNEPTSTLVLKGRFSNTNFDKLVLSARNITTVDLSFATFAFDALDGTWYDRLKNSDAGISGKIEHIETVQRFKQGQEYFQEVLMEISPSSKEDNQFIKYMASNDMETLKEIKWSHNSKNVCEPGSIANQGKSYFNELFESAILL
ncbi:hypothetical protein A0J61_02111 [Choanephora cucurbitarum]|uniref:Uncharacterized protein n=1 Tax=Choanephora cucurbitarum TaxID=101091 RepID=A0A1C7NLG1_9FUNG|nr:hypothetical protein A0J61_02111 [Choanephora cucurbitarum]